MKRDPSLGRWTGGVLGGAGHGGGVVFPTKHVWRELSQRHEVGLRFHSGVGVDPPHSVQSVRVPTRRR